MLTLFIKNTKGKTGNKHAVLLMFWLYSNFYFLNKKNIRTMILNNKTWYSLDTSKKTVYSNLDSYSSVVILSSTFILLLLFIFYHSITTLNSLNKQTNKKITLSAPTKLHFRETLHSHIKHTTEQSCFIYRTQEVCPAILVLLFPCPCWAQRKAK